MVRKTNLHLQQLLIDLFYYHRKLSLSIHSIQTYDILDMFGHNWSNNRQKGTRPRLLQTNNYIGSDLLGVYSLELPSWPCTVPLICLFL